MFGELEFLALLVASQEKAEKGYCLVSFKLMVLYREKVLLWSKEGELI